MRYMSIALVLLLGLAIGCATVTEGKKIDATKTKNLLATGTTPQKVVEMFGQPQQTETLPSGETKYVYYYRVKSRMWWHADPKEHQRLEVFMKDNQVQRYRYVDSGVDPITKDIPPIEPVKK